MTKEEFLESMEQAYNENKVFLLAFLNDEDCISLVANGTDRDLMAMAYGILKAVCQEVSIAPEEFWRLAKLADKAQEGE